MHGFEENIASGTAWLSKTLVTKESLVNFLMGMWRTDDDFIFVSFREGGVPGEWCLDFRYRHGGEENSFDNFVAECRAQLETAFGEGYLRQDIASETYIIK